MALGSGRFWSLRTRSLGCCSAGGRFSEFFTGFAWGHRFLHVLYGLFESLLLQYNEELENYDSSRNRFASPLFMLTT